MGNGSSCSNSSSSSSKSLVDGTRAEILLEMTSTKWWSSLNREG